MPNNSEVSAVPELPNETTIALDPELYEKLIKYKNVIANSNISEAEMMLDFGMREITVDELANMAIRIFFEGVSEEFPIDSFE